MTLPHSPPVIVYWQTLKDGSGLYRNVPSKHNGADDGGSNEETSYREEAAIEQQDGYLDGG